MELGFALAALSFFGELDRVACTPGWWLPSEQVCAVKYMECRRLLAKIDGEKSGTTHHLLRAQREWLVVCAAWWDVAYRVRIRETPVCEKLLLLERLR